MKYRWRDRFLLGAPGFVLAALVVMLALENHSGERLINALLGGFGLILVWSVAVAVQLRYPQRPLGPLLFLLAACSGLSSLMGSLNPVLFMLGRIARPTGEILLIWIMLAYPSGRLSGTRDRSLVIATALSVLVLWLPSVALTTSLAMVGPYMVCQIDCPRNLLLIADQPLISHQLSTAFRYVAAMLLAITVFVLYRRLREATQLMQRVLAPVVLASIVRLIVVANIVMMSDASRMAFTLSFWAIPLAIAVGLLRGRLYAARVLQLLVSGMRRKSEVHSLRAVMATALDDNSLEIAYWIKDQGRWVDDFGQPVTLTYPAVTLSRAVTVIQNAQGAPVAALLHDAALLEEPTLVESVARSMQTVFEFERLEAEVKASQTQTVSAVEMERRRIERDLHDGAQQRLIALRMKLSVTERILEQDPGRAALLIHELGSDVDAAIKDLRNFAHGVVPPLLAERGLSQALIEVAQRAAIPIVIQVEEIGRCEAVIESAVYYCCLEALQNAAKHGGSGATVTLKLRREGQRLDFEVSNNLANVANDERPSMEGQGLANMRERVQAVGGQLRIGIQGESIYLVSGFVPFLASQIPG